MKLFKSNISQLIKVNESLRLSQKMNGTQVILGKLNEKKRQLAENHIRRAILILNDIE
jgi:hypothetical protein